jgi:hypothetical protein
LGRIGNLLPAYAKVAVKQDDSRDKEKIIENCAVQQVFFSRFIAQGPPWTVYFLSHGVLCI